MKHLFSRLLTLSTIALVAMASLAPSLRATDLSITTANFAAGNNAIKQIGKAGAAISIGQLVYFDSTAASWKLADANASAATAFVGGIAATASSASGQDIIVITEDNDLTLGATLSTSAPVYVVSATAGGVAPSADISTGWYASVVLISKSTTKCVFKAGALRGTAVTTEVIFDFGHFPRLAFIPMPHRKLLAWREDELALAA